MRKALQLAAICLSTCAPALMAQNSSEFAPFKFKVLTIPEDNYGDDYVIQKVWQTDISDTANRFGSEPQSIAYHKGIIYVPQNYYNSASEFNLRRFDALTGEELETVPLKLSAYDLNIIKGVQNFSDLYFYVVNDQAGNLIVIIDVVYSGVPSEYPVFIGMIHTYDYSVPWVHKVNIKSNTGTPTWGQLGHPQVFGDYAALFSDDDQSEFKSDLDETFSIKIPISFVNGSRKFESCYFASIVPADIQSGSTIARVFLPGSSLGNRFDHIMESKRDYMAWIDESTILYDTYSTVPLLGYDKKGVGLGMVSDFDKNNIYEQAKGINAFNLGNHRFLVVGNSTGDRGDFILCSWDAELPQSTNANDADFDQSLIPYLHLGLEESASAQNMATPLSDFFRNDSQPWHLSNIVEAVNPAYTHTKDIHIYYPGSYLASYRIGTSDRFSGIGAITVTESDYENEDSWWTLTGLRIEGKPSGQGIYIHRANGKASKVLIK